MKSENSDIIQRDLPDAIGGYPEICQSEGRELDSEGRAIILDFGLFVLIGTYCPAVCEIELQKYRMQWLDVLEQRVRNLISLGRNIILLGDIKIARDINDISDTKEALRKTSGNFKGTPARQWLDKILYPYPNAIFYDLCREQFPNKKGMFTCWETRLNARQSNFDQGLIMYYVHPTLKNG